MVEGEMWETITKYSRNKLVPEQSVRKSVSVNGYRFDMIYERFSFISAVLKLKLTGSEETIQFVVCYDGQVVSRDTAYLFFDEGRLIITGGKYHNFLVQEDGVRTHYMVTMIVSPEAPGFEIMRNQKEIVATIPVGR
ncbi:MAG: hypothetical protein KGD60_13220 [Candidatus Thorarchaeota archaeon]|nr:hypothetical protein [Candidatus Thorarchaeota archaeon]